MTMIDLFHFVWMGFGMFLFRISLTAIGVKYQITDYREVTFKYVFRLVWLTCTTMISMLACMDLLVGLDSKCITYLGCFRNPSTLIQHGPPPFPPPVAPFSLPRHRGYSGRHPARQQSPFPLPRPAASGARTVGVDVSFPLHGPGAGLWIQHMTEQKL